MAKAKVICGDCTKVLKKLPNNYFSSCVTDPPYELGFMGKSWDASGIAYNVDMWREVLRVLKPGAHLLSFGGSRTYHRMACAIEDAGFEIRDQIQWIYGCLSSDTEILINGQWEPYHKTIEGSLVLCYNIDKDTFAWMPVQEVFVYEYSDTAYRIVSDITDQLVSRNHRCIVEQDGKRVFRIAEEIARQRQACVPVLEDVQGLLKAIPLPHQRTGATEPNVFERVREETDWFAKSRARSQSTNICNVPDMREAICPTARNTQSGLLQSSMCRQGEGVSETVFRQHEGTQENGQALRREEPCMEGRRDVFQDSWKLCGCEVREMSSGISANGSERRICDGAQVACCTTDREDAQAVRSGASFRPRPEEQSTRESGVVFEQCPSQEIRGQGFTTTTLARVEPVEYSGLMWCVRVPTGAFVARRNGRTFVTGNSGFPKSLDISKAIDKAAGAERTEGVRLWTGGRRTGCIANSSETNLGTQTLIKYDTPATPEAQRWQGWGTALKPSHENIVLAQKPYTCSRERDIIDVNLSILEARLWSLLPASVAVESFKLSQSEFGVVCASAQWSAEERRNTQDVLLAQMDMSQFVSAMTSCLSIVSSWRSIWAEVSCLMSKSTTETASSLTTELKTLNSSLSAITPKSIILDAMEADGSKLLVSPVARSLNAALWKLRGIPTPSVAESATSRGLPNFRPEADSIVVARKPLSEPTVAANVLKHGTGGINVDGCRIELRAAGEDKRLGGNGTWGTSKMAKQVYEGGYSGIEVGSSPLGRWPANVCFDEEAAELLGAPSRFFYCAKASPSERNAGCEDYAWIPKQGNRPNSPDATGKFPDHDHRPSRGNFHPTVKPLALMRWLVKLVTPPRGVVLDPFLGSGTTALAAIAEGFSVLGIEKEPAYCAISRKRLAL